MAKRRTPLPCLGLVGLGLILTGQARVLASTLSIARGGALRMNPHVVGEGGEFVRRGRHCGFVADDRNDQVGDFAAGFFRAVGLECRC